MTTPQWEDEPITALKFPDQGMYFAGRGEIQKITVEHVNGQMAAVPWFVIWKDDKPWRRVNSIFVEEVLYDDQ